MTALDWTETTFDAAHKGEYAEQIHGHTWHVRVWWPASPPKDARFMHARLRQYLEASFDHRLLDDVIPDPTNYGVAKALLQLMGDDIKIIEVWRGGAVPCGARTIHRHAGPITGADVFATVAGRNFLASYETSARSWADSAEQVAQTLWFDPGAYTIYRRLQEAIRKRRAAGEVVTVDEEHELLHAPRDWRGYYDWLDARLDRPTTLAIIPDVIDGASQLQDSLIKEWPYGKKGVPVFHIHHSAERMLRLLDEWDWVAFGSAGEYWEILSPQWEERMHFLWNEIAKRHQRTPQVHMLRGMQLCLKPNPFPFASLDSSDVGQNHNRPQNTALDMINRWDAAQCPARYTPRAHQLSLLDIAA